MVEILPVFEDLTMSAMAGTRPSSASVRLTDPSFVLLVISVVVVGVPEGRSLWVAAFPPGLAGAAERIGPADVEVVLCST